MDKLAGADGIRNHLTILSKPQSVQAVGFAGMCQKYNLTPISQSHGFDLQSKLCPGSLKIRFIFAEHLAGSSANDT